MKKQEFQKFRNYSSTSHVSHLYWAQHSMQTVEMVRILQRRVFNRHNKYSYSVCEMYELGKQLVDTSDPDALLPQAVHWMQASLSAIKAKESSAVVVSAFMHDMGKVALHYFYGITGAFNWGDTFIIGCRHDIDAIETEQAAPGAFALNPDGANEKYNTRYGIYKPHCGLDKLTVSFGHDEVIYNVAMTNREKFRTELPQTELDYFRWHSCYPIHTGYQDKKGYAFLLKDGDQDRLTEVRHRVRHELYSKRDIVNPDLELYSQIDKVLQHVDVYLDPDTKLYW